MRVLFTHSVIGLAESSAQTVCTTNQVVAAIAVVVTRLVSKRAARVAAWIRGRKEFRMAEDFSVERGQALDALDATASLFDEEDAEEESASKPAK